jgi:hypothetical protein
MPISFAVFVGFFEFAPGIHQFQIVQSALDTLDIFIVKSERFSAEELEGILEKIRAGSKGELKLQVKFVSEIPSTASGKRRLVVSRFGFSGVSPERTLA